ncbi:hypothetical protein STAPHY8AQ_20800 [Staphylococcus sp. 8AQ]|nr:hypothetical protein STAPHY8AQ_20800 [Staphylococcus sp. 8AQ]
MTLCLFFIMISQDKKVRMGDINEIKKISINTRVGNYSYLCIIVSIY